MDFYLCTHPCSYHPDQDKKGNAFLNDFEIIIKNENKCSAPVGFLMPLLNWYLSKASTALTLSFRN